MAEDADFERRLAILRNPDLDPKWAQALKIAKARRDGLIPGYPEVVSCGDGLDGATTTFADGSVSKRGAPPETPKKGLKGRSRKPKPVTRASKELARYRAGTITFDRLVNLLPRLDEHHRLVNPRLLDRGGHAQSVAAPRRPPLV
jgi:hypothetical protein